MTPNLRKTINCAKCKKIIKSREMLQCAACENAYDVSCTTNVSILRFRLMTLKNRKEWKCHLCWNKSLKTNSTQQCTDTTTNTSIDCTTVDNIGEDTLPRDITSESPRRETDQETRVHPTRGDTEIEECPAELTVGYVNSTPCFSSSASTPTPTKNKEIKQTPSKIHNESVSQYDLDIFVTQRVRKTSWHSMGNCEEATMADTTANSLPELAIRADNLKVQELEMDVTQLELKLASADNEIELLLHENCELKKIIREMERKTGRYKHLYIKSLTTPNKRLLNKIVSEKPGQKGKKIIFDKFPDNTIDTTGKYKGEDSKPEDVKSGEDEKSGEVSINVTEDCQKQTKETSMKTINLEKGASNNKSDSKIPIDVDDLGQESDKNSYMRGAKRSTCPAIKHRVLLLADQTGRGVRNIIQKLLGNDFDVTSYLKPQSTIDQVLCSSQTLCKGFTKADFVLVMAGSNDKNPTKFKILLEYLMNQLTHTNVLLCEIHRNIHLNVKKLNDLIKEVCDNIDHTRLIQVNDCDRRKDYINRIITCKQMLKEILHINYETRFHDYTNRLTKRDVGLMGETSANLKGICVGTQTEHSFFR